MKSRKWKYVLSLYIFLIIGIGLFCLSAYMRYKDATPETISVKAGITKKLIPVGQPIGIYVKTDGVLVIDTGSFSDGSGASCAPSEYKLESGDYIVAVDGIEVSGKREIKEYVEGSGGSEIIFDVSRNDEEISVKIKPELDENGTYKIGAWLRDSAQGIGTLTYVDTQGNFGALGHGINDTDTGELLKLGTGLLYNTQIVAVQKGEKGTPGELTGIIEYKDEEVVGVISDNTSQGIYGVVSDELLEMCADESEAIPVAQKYEVKLGAAQILCAVDGESRYYDVEITKINVGSNVVNRQISLKVTDSELLSLTGGIVQGMSGAPIVQDGRFVGAVTHVLVQDATKGYGIFVEDMLSVAQE